LPNRYQLAPRRCSRAAALAFGACAVLDYVAAHSSTDLPAVRPHWLWPTRRRVIVGLIVAFAVWGWFDVRNRGLFDPSQRWLHKTDFTVYTEAGAAFFDGRDPYNVTNLRGWGYLYPPLFAILVAPLHALDTRAQVLVWFALSVLMGWGCYRELVRIARVLLPRAPENNLFGPIPVWLGTTACTAAMLPALNCLQRGQVGVAKLYLLLLGFRLLIASRAGFGPLMAGCVFALSIVLKITPAVPVAMAIGQQWTSAWYAGIGRTWSRATSLSLGTAAGLMLCLLVLPAALVGWRANLEHLGTWWSSVAVHAESISQSDIAGDSTTARNQSLTNAAHRMGNWAHYYFAGGPDDNGPQQLRLGGAGLVMDAPAADAVLWVVRGLVVGLTVAVGFRMAKSRDPLGQAAAFGMACAATLVVFSIARGHYYVMLLPAVTFVGLWLLQHGRAGWAVTLSVAPCALVIVHYALLDYAGRIGVLGLGTTVWYLAACGVLLWPARVAAARSSGLPDRSRTEAERPLAA
jgi:Glycosyltransferase family 87